MERIALAFSDGSFNVHPDGWPIERAVAERDEADKNCRETERTKIVRVNLEIVDDCVVPLRPTGKPCKCGKVYLTIGGIEECVARQHK